MSFALAEYARCRPFLYHLTAWENIDYIRFSGRLASTAVLLAAADQEYCLREKRDKIKSVVIESRQVLIRDQKPLHEAHIEFSPGWTFARFIEHLNRRVFFWSGGERGPVGDYGKNHFESHQTENPVIIRVPFNSLCRQNLGREPLFCKYNSGAPRTTYKRKSPRGEGTFLPADQCEYTWGKVVEVTFLDAVALPHDTQFSNAIYGPWKSLFADSR